MFQRSSDLKLLQGLKNKHHRALQELYDTYGEIMYGLAFNILKNRQESEDLIQEIFLALWRNCNYDPERGTFKTFLLVLVRSRAIDRLRSRKTSETIIERSTRELQTRESGNLPLEITQSAEIAGRVREALADLPEKQREALEMAYFQGLTQKEISERLDVSIGTVKSWFRLGFVKLRQSLQDLTN